MKRFGAIILAVLLMTLMAVPVLAEETPATDAPAATEEATEEGFFTFADGSISGSYESDGLVNIYLNDELAGGSTLNVPISTEEEGVYTITVYENGKLVHTEEVQAGAQEPIVEPEDPGQEEPVDPTPADPTPADPTTPEKPADNSGSTTPSKTPASNVPKTGDAENMGTFMVLGLGAALTLAAAKRVKSR